MKDQAIASILLGLESSSARASTLARQEIIHGRRISPDEVVEKIRATTPEELREVARTYFRSEVALTWRTRKSQWLQSRSITAFDLKLSEEQLN